MPEIQYCLFYFTVLKDLFYFNFKFPLFYFSFVVLVVLLCCIIVIIITYWEFPEFHSTFKKMHVGAEIIMSRVPRLSCKSRLCFKKGVLKISSYKPAHVNTAGAQSTVLVWSYTLAAVPILGSAPSDVSLLWAALQLTTTLCFLRLSHCFRSCVADVSAAFHTYMPLT